MAPHGYWFLYTENNKHYSSFNVICNKIILIQYLDIWYKDKKKSSVPVYTRPVDERYTC